MREPLSILTPVFPAGEVHPAFFLDRDDTLIYDVPYLKDAGLVRLTPKAAAGLRVLRQAGWRLIVVSNQSGVNRGRFTEGELRAVLQRMSCLLQRQSVQLDAIYCCPHAPEEDCACRKPRTGLFDLARRDFAIDMARSVMAGDKAGDIASGRAAGLRTIQVRIHDGVPALPDADFTAGDLEEAARKCLQWQAAD